MFTIQSLLTCHQRKSSRTTTRGLTSLPRILSERAALQPPLTGTPGPSTPLQVWSGVSPQPTGGWGDWRGLALPVGRRSPTTKPALALVACCPLPGSGPWTGPHRMLLSSLPTKSSSPPAPASSPPPPLPPPPSPPPPRPTPPRP